MNRDRDNAQIGDDVTITLSGRVVDICYDRNKGTVAWLRIESQNGVSKLFFPHHFRDFTFTAIPDDVRGRWSA